MGDVAVRRPADDELTIAGQSCQGIRCCYRSDSRAVHRRTEDKLRRWGQVTGERGGPDARHVLRRGVKSEQMVKDGFGYGEAVGRGRDKGGAGSHLHCAASCIYGNPRVRARVGWFDPFTATRMGANAFLRTSLGKERGDPRLIGKVLEGGACVALKEVCLCLN